jgi:CRISPR/Cas system-associated exonuclease Cas4 (RecB family)
MNPFSSQKIAQRKTELMVKVSRRLSFISRLSRDHHEKANLFQVYDKVLLVGKIKFIRGGPKEIYDSALTEFLKDFKEAPLDVALIVPRPGMASHIRSSLLVGTTVPLFSVPALDDIVAYIFDQYEKDILQVSGTGVRNIVRSLLNENAKDFQSFFNDGKVRDGVIDDLLVMLHTIRDFNADLSKYQMDDIFQADIPLFLSLYEIRLKEEGLLDPIGVRLKVASDLDAWCEDRPLFKKLIILGQFEPSASQTSVLRALIRNCDEVVYHHPYVPGSKKVYLLPTLDIAENTEIIDLPSQERTARRTLMVREWSDDSKIDLTSEVFLARFLDPIAEARQSAQRISQLIKAGTDPDDIAIFLPERRDALPLMKEVLNDFSIPFKTDTGTPLACSPAVHTAVTVLDTVTNGYSPDHLIKLLSSPYVRWDVGGEKLHHEEVDRLSRIIRVNKGRGTWLKGMDALLDRARSPNPGSSEAQRARGQKEAERLFRTRGQLEALFNELDDLNVSGTVEEHIKRFHLALKALGWTDSLERSRWNDEDPENAACSALLRVLDSMEDGGGYPIDDVISLTRFTSELKREIGGVTYHGGGMYDRAVNVAGYRSLAGRHFKHSFLLFTTEGDMPKLSVKHPFLNTKQAKALGLLSEEDILRQERFYFLMALLSGDSVNISYPSYQGGKRALPSPFLIDVQKNAELGVMEELPLPHSQRCSQIYMGRSIAGDVVEHEDAWLSNSSISPESICERLNIEMTGRQGPYASPYDGIIDDKEIIGRINEGRDTKGFSATMLETYCKCPMKYYLSYVLRLHPIGGMEDTEVLRIGNLAHEALFRFYHSRTERGEGMVSDDEDLAVVKAELRGLCMKDDFETSAQEAAGMRSLIGDDNMNGALGTFVDFQAEIDRPRWTPSYLELGFGIKAVPGDTDPRSTDAPVSLSIGGMDLTIRGKVDRVDTDVKGNFVIIDYKTGSAPKKENMAKGYNMQLPLYMMACEKLLGLKAAGGAYYQLRQGSGFGMNFMTAAPEHFDEFGIGPRSKMDLQADFRKCCENVKMALDGMANGRFHPVNDLDAERCKYCLFDKVCRKDEMRILRMTLGPEVV